MGAQPSATGGAVLAGALLGIYGLPDVDGALVIEDQRVKVAGASLEVGAPDMVGYPPKLDREPFLATLK